MAVRGIVRKEWTDLDLDFFRNPVTGVGLLVGISALARSVRQLVELNYYEKKFDHDIGSGVVKLLFDQVGPLTAGFLKNAVVEVIGNFEPRVKLVDVGVVVDPDGNGFLISLAFIEISSGRSGRVEFFLDRIR